MRIYNICFEDFPEESGHPVRAGSAAEAADLYISAYLDGTIRLDDEVVARQKRLEIRSVSLDTGGKGVMRYAEPEIREIPLANLPSWSAALAAGYRPGNSPAEWCRDEDFEP